ncbi:MAG: hypothetical protein ACT4OZ_04225 [Gemmatimonadota bacterium]
MRNPFVFPTLALSVLFAAAASDASGQSGDISLAVLPFGVLPGASAAQRSAPALSQEVVTVAGESGLYTIIDRSADRQIEEELRNAESFRNFDSRVQLNTTGRLNAAVLLMGVVEEQTIDINRPTKSGERATYSARLGLRVKLVKTETGEVIKSAFFTLRSGSQASQIAKDRGLDRIIPKSIQDAVSRKIDEKVNTEAAKQGADMLAYSQEEAIRSAASSLRKPLSEFLQNSYGAVVAASRRKGSGS